MFDSLDSSDEEHIRKRKQARLNRGKSHLISADNEEKKERRLNFIFSLMLKLVIVLLLMATVIALLVFFFRSAKQAVPENQLTRIP